MEKKTVLSFILIILLCGCAKYTTNSTPSTTVQHSTPISTPVPTPNTNKVSSDNDQKLIFKLKKYLENISDALLTNEDRLGNLSMVTEELLQYLS